MSSEKKLNESERKQLEKLQTKLNDKVLEYGRQEYIVEQIKEELERERQAASELRNEITEKQDDYESYVQELYKKYGDVAIDLNSGNILDPDET
jgi:EAL domain-containing protein (putative c-di-GMP-specific phosphodiesterase class I)